MWGGVSVHSFLPSCTCISQNLGNNGFTAMQKTFIIVVFAKNASSEATASFACLGCHELHLYAKRRIPKESAEGWKDTGIRNLTKNALFRSYGTFAYLLRAHIRNINMRMYITSARGHELSGRVRA